MDIARDICTDSFYIVNSGLPCIPVTAVDHNYSSRHYHHHQPLSLNRSIIVVVNFIIIVGMIVINVSSV